jgi:hypothetical protein
MPHLINRRELEQCLLESGESALNDEDLRVRFREAIAEFVETWEEELAEDLQMGEPYEDEEFEEEEYDE